MPRSGGGVYTLPAGSVIANGDTSDAADLNTPLADIEADMNTPRPVVAGGTGATNAADARTNLGVQPLDADLTAIAGLSSNGIVTRTGAGTAAARTITPGAGIAVSNGDGVSGDPVISSLIAGRNRIINGQGRINQRGYVSGTNTTGANQYTLDRWRVVTSGQNLTFTGDDSKRTMTAPAGGCEQVIEGANIEGGTYTINWTGTATCTVDGVSRAKGATFTLTANTNCTVRFSSGTFTDVQLELASVPTPFERLPISDELARCQRYLYQIGGVSGVPWASPGLAGAGSSRAAIFFPVAMRAAPSLGVTGTGFQASDNTLGPVTATVSLVTASPFSANLSYSHAGLTANAARTLLTSDATSFLRFDSEL